MFQIKIIETETVNRRDTGEEFQVRLLKRGDNDWGVDTTIKQGSSFGFSEESARRVYETVIYSWRNDR